MTQIIHNYSAQATRTRPWENWTEPPKVESLPKAKYFGMTVRVVQMMTQLAVIDWKGNRMLVEVSDLVEVR